MIESTDNDRVKYLKKLRDKKYIDMYKEFLVETPHLVEEAFKAGCLKEIFVVKEYEGMLEVKTTNISLKVMKDISVLSTPSNVIGLCSKIDMNDDIGSRVVLLDDIQDPGNLGTIIRTSLAFNIDTICLSKNSVGMYNDKVIRSSEGMIFHINIKYVDLKDVIIQLKEKGIIVYATQMENGTELKSISKRNEYAVLLGNEGKGIKKELIDMCDASIYIKMNDKCESLNVALSTAIILYNLWEK
ncbi:MAG: RNA methyltransferase [Bacilli bacterium]